MTAPTFTRVVLRPAPGQRAADLCRDLIAIAGSSQAVRSAGANGFLVDDATAVTYLTHAAEPDPAPEPQPEPEPATEPGREPGDDGPAAEPDPSTTTDPGGPPATAAGPARPRRVPARKAAMKGAPDGE